jgi:hypothetical protein
MMQLGIANRWVWARLEAEPPGFPRSTFTPTQLFMYATLRHASWCVLGTTVVARVIGQAVLPVRLLPCCSNLAVPSRV